MYRNLLLLIQLSLDINVMLNYMLPQSLLKTLEFGNFIPFTNLTFVILVFSLNFGFLCLYSSSEPPTLAISSSKTGLAHSSSKSMFGGGTLIGPGVSMFG